MDSLYIGMDIGGTNLRCALVDSSGVVSGPRRCASRIEDGRDAFCERLLSEIAELKVSARLQGKQIRAVGILIGRDGVIHSSVNLRPLDGFNWLTVSRPGPDFR
jgi:glucokinase